MPDRLQLSGALADRFPNLWEQGKQHLNIEEIRYDLHEFFSAALEFGTGRGGAVSSGPLSRRSSSPAPRT